MSTRLAYSPADVLAADTAVHRSYSTRIREAVDYFEGCHLGAEFSADDVVAHIDINHDQRPHHGNVIGAMFAHLHETGRIRHVGWTRSVRPEARGRQIQTWRVVPKPPVGRGNTPAPPGRA